MRTLAALVCLGRRHDVWFDVVMETERLLLRLVLADDLDDLVALDADPAVMRYINAGRPTARADVAASIAESAGCRWVAHERGGRAFVGWFALRPGDAARDYELGYRLRRECWGRGLATKGARTMLHHRLRVLDAERVWAQTMTVNLASRAVLERCGLRYVRTFFATWPDVIEGSEEGDVEYEITRTTVETDR